MDSVTRRLTKAVKEHDSLLYVERDNHGGMNLWRKDYRKEFFSYNGNTYSYMVSSPYFVLRLSDDWTTRGRPVEWGVEPLLHRIRSIDLWNKDSESSNVEKSQIKAMESKDREIKNMHEAMTSEMHSSFKKAFSYTN